MNQRLKHLTLIATLLCARIVVQAQAPEKNSRTPSVVSGDTSQSAADSRNSAARPDATAPEADTSNAANTPENSSPRLKAPIQSTSSLPLGTAVKMKLETALSTTMNHVGDRFEGRVTEDVVVNGKTVIPVGSSIQGVVMKSSEPRRIAGLPAIELRPDQITLPNGDKMMISAVVVDAANGVGMKVDDEGMIKGKGIDHTDKIEMLGGAGAGAGIGALAMHSIKATWVGAAVGGGAAVVYWLTKRHSAYLPAGTEIVMELSRPMALDQAAD